MTFIPLRDLRELARVVGEPPAPCHKDSVLQAAREALEWANHHLPDQPVITKALKLYEQLK